ncbi:ribosomal protein RPL24 [Cardiosporidium cionae]|uniref:Ribosomal protein RPL24 n=1 Tax=Cardiosporidium cionae TaxID=476202 RepID=A0ABQ7JEC1_9APIC|nr:ribosomal protein RPL24 [Cardiosporidium cionae]|eukprot:KAF8822326.1 ribosomal protein RPL24 [Cardiosporidium cionae]
MASTVKTTIKTDVCSFSEYRVYPGRGKRVVAHDGKVYFYIGKKQASLAAQKIKPAKITWTQSWRRMNKKMQAIVGHRRKTHRRVKTSKAIEGLTLDEIKRKQTEKPEARMAVRDAAMKEARELAQKKKELQSKKAAAGGHAKGQARGSAAKPQKQNAKGQKGVRRY